MAKLYLATVVVVVFSAVVINNLVNPCRNVYESFRDILGRHRRQGRVSSNTTVSLLRQFVFTKMECLEICLRNPLCDSFEMRQKFKVNDKKNMWACKIYQISKSTEKKEDTNAGLNNWIHFDISSQKIEKVNLCFQFTASLFQFTASLLSSYMFLFLLNFFKKRFCKQSS